MGNKEDQAHQERIAINSVQDFLNRQELDYFYGFSCDDIERLNNAFADLTQNNETTFPDFYNKDACIEIFNVSSSVTKRRKGALQMQKDAELKRKIARDDKEAAESNNLESRSYRQINPEHSYENLTENLRFQVKKHVDSKRSAKNTFGTCVFVIEYMETGLDCIFWTHDNSMNFEGICIGDLMYPMYETEKWNSCEIVKRKGQYRLSRDRDNLEWLGQYSDDVDYILFCGRNVIEAINLHRVREITAFLPWKLLANPITTLTVVTSIPFECERTADSYVQD